jgi:chaperone modulatory protein CbpM
MKNLPDRKGCLISEIGNVLDVDRDFVIYCVEVRWITPARSEEPVTRTYLDEEDLARLELIRDLREHLGVNDEGISVALHLLDQIYALRASIRTHVPR